MKKKLTAVALVVCMLAIMLVGVAMNVVLGTKMDLSIRIQREEIFDAMHRI